MTMMFNNSLWGITPEAGAELDTIYLRHLRGETPDLAAIEARTGKQLGAKRAAMTIDNGTALVQLSGVMVRGAGLLGDISGATDPSAVQAEIEQAAADPTVQRIVLYVDSPGGSISGVAQLADALYSAGQNVDTVAVIDALGASAAYRVASQANTVLLADATSAAGSIGVILKHIDQSGADASRGVKVTEIKAGQFKGLGSPHKPLSEGDTSEMQRLVDSTYQTFLGAVQRGRGTSNQETMQMGDARIHQGQAAIDADLADGIGTLDQVLARPPRRVTAQQAAQAAPVIGAARRATRTRSPRRRARISTHKRLSATP